MLKSNKIYFRATLITICVILANQLFIQYWLYQKKMDAEVINIGGRQRMYSQRIVNLCFALKNGAKDVTPANIQNLYQQWIQSHDFLIQTHTPNQFSPAFTSVIYSGLKELDVYIKAIEPFIQQPQEISSKDFERFRKNQDLFLNQMNNIVFALEKNSSSKLQMIIGIEILFALISLFMIYFEITFIFKKINQNLSKQNVALEDSNQMLEQYAYLAAHDLRSPTQNIINFSKLLNTKLATKMDDAEKTYFGFILDSANRMQETTDELLKFSSINHEKINLGDCQPKAIIEDAVKDLQLNIQEKDAQINIGTLPENIRADRKLLHLVFQNLIANSIKFVPETTKPNIDISHQENSNQHIFTIRDNGIGIEQQYLNKIFGLFKRLNSNSEYKGTGIGLSICQKVIEKHKGQIQVQSELAKGSSFSFSIPK